MYCPKCRIVSDGERCPECGSRKLREPAAEDLCFLTEEDPLMGGMLEDVLRQNGIPALGESNKGAALSVISGPLFEWIRYYVRWEDLDKAREIVNEVLHTAEESDAADGGAAEDGTEEDSGEPGEEP